jgi:uncharacterized membrane protein
MSDARPSWTLAEIGGLLGWAESGALTSEELGRAGAQAPLAPSPAHWRHAADRLLAFAGILLMATGLVFFFAYNWDDLHRYAKLGLAWSAMAACGVAALFVQPGSIAYRAALLGAAIATGVLLALIGQTYQTGADLWELFAAWLLLITPFALLARSSATWLLWVLLANLALGRYLSTSSWFIWLGLLSGPEGLYLMAGINLGLLLGFEAFAARLLVMPRRLVQRLLALGVIAPLAAGAGIGWWDADYLVLTPAFFLLGGLGFWFYRDRRRDVPILAMVVFAAIAVLTLGLAKWLPDDFFAYNLVALFVIACTGYAAVWLLRLVKQGAA